MVEAHTRPAHSEYFETRLEEIQRRTGSDMPLIFRRPENWVRRRLGLAYGSIGASVVMGAVGIAARGGLALLATAVAADWSQVNWVGWAIILGFYAFQDSVMSRFTPPPDVPLGPFTRKLVEDAGGLLPTMIHDADIEDLAAFARRWIRLPFAATVGAIVTIATLGATWAIMPDALSQVAAGTIVLVALSLFDFGSSTVAPGDWILIARESRYDHDLLWASPADSPEVKAAMSVNTGFGVMTGIWMTISMILTIVLVGWGSPLVLPIAAGFTIFGYVSVIASTLGIRGSIQRIVERARERWLAPLREQIAAREPTSADITPGEADRLQRLLDLYASIRDAPGTSSRTHTFLHTAAALVAPTIMFVISVSGEVYAERLFDTFLP